jgi:hypothetical protein
MDIGDAHRGRGRGAVEEEEAHWVGTIMTSSVIADVVNRRALQLVLLAMDCTALLIDNGVRNMHYMGFCKQVLWQAFHHIDLLDMRHPAFLIDLDSTTARLPPDGTLRRSRPLVGPVAGRALVRGRPRGWCSRTTLSGSTTNICHSCHVSLTTRRGRWPARTTRWVRPTFDAMIEAEANWIERKKQTWKWNGGGGGDAGLFVVIFLEKDTRRRRRKDCHRPRKEGLGTMRGGEEEYNNQQWLMGGGKRQYDNEDDD